MARIGVLTILPEEFAAVQSVFGVLRNIPGTPYFVNAIADLQVMKFDIVVCRATDRGNLPASQALGDLLEAFKPAFVFLVGIAGGFGGRDGLSVGDVVIADAVEYCEFKKLHKGKILRRLVPLSHPSAYLRSSFAEPLSLDAQKWLPHVRIERPVPGEAKAIIGNIVAGETLMADPGSTLQRNILKHYDKSLAVDMESFGVAYEVFAHRSGLFYNPQYLIIRGISDLVNPDAANIDNQETRDRWKPYAAEVAAAFAWVLSNNCLNATRTYFEDVDQEQTAIDPVGVGDQGGGRHE
jgi:nucleoside phosphorylase